MRSFRLLIIMLITSTFLSSCASSDYRVAHDKDTIESYRQFIVKYPNSDYSEKAKQRLAELSFDKAQKEDTIEAYYEFIYEFSSSGYSEKAEERLTDLAFKEAQQKNTPEAYRKFLKISHVKNKNYSESAQQKINEFEKIAFDKALRDDTPDAYQKYLKEFPNDKYSIEAKRRLEAYSYENVLKNKTPEACKNYLKEFPDSVHAQEIKDRLEIYTYENVLKNKTPEVCKNYLKEFPNSIHSQEIRNILDEFIITAFEKAQKEDSPEGYAAFLKEYPVGPYAERVRGYTAGKCSSSKDEDLIIDDIKANGIGSRFVVPIYVISDDDVRRERRRMNLKSRSNTGPRFDTPDAQRYINKVEENILAARKKCKITLKSDGPHKTIILKKLYSDDDGGVYFEGANPGRLIDGNVVRLIGVHQISDKHNKYFWITGFNNSPISFLLVAGKGWVYLHGKGMILTNDRKKITLP